MSVLHSRKSQLVFYTVGNFFTVVKFYINNVILPLLMYFLKSGPQLQRLLQPRLSAAALRLHILKAFWGFESIRVLSIRVWCSWLVFVGFGFLGSISVDLSLNFVEFYRLTFDGRRRKQLFGS